MDPISTAFAPDAGRVVFFDRLMRERLTESLRYLYGLVREHIDIAEDTFESGLKRILAQPVPPDCFAAYYELAYAAQEGDMELVESLFSEVLSPESPRGLDIFPFRERSRDARSFRYVNPIDTDPAMPFAILPVEEKDFEKARDMIHEALDVLKNADPALHDEIRALLRVIMVGAGTRDKKARTFDGASAFELWGAIVLNAIEARDVVDMIQTLAHESCHVMLFGFCIDGRLVLNPDSERHPSPLRTDPRPIDGIYHAVFVLARMFYASAAIIENSSLPAELIAKAETTRLGFAQRFYDGLGTLKQHARYTGHGRELMDAAEGYMNENARHLLV